MPRVRAARSRVRRRLLATLLAVIALLTVAATYEAVQEAVDARTQAMTGQLVDVGGHRLHLRCTGSGSPTVVLEPGLGEASPVLSLVASQVAADTRVCVYDRAGRGWSDPADRPLDGRQTAADLHTLLHRAQVDGPYVLAGHSFGGLYALAFAAAYPNEVAGLVLIDSTAPRPGAPAAGPSSDDLTARLLGLLPAAAHLGLARLWAHYSYDGLPAPAREEAVSRAARAAHVRSFVAELEEGSAAVHQAAACTDLQGKPLVVLTAGEGHDAAWTADQDKLAALSTNSRHRVVAGATHTSLILDPEGATATAQAVRDVVTSARRDDEP